MTTLSKTLRSLVVALVVAVPGHALGDVPLTGAGTTFGPAPLSVVAAGVGLGTQPATLSVTVPAGGSVAAAYLYVTGRGAGDGSVQLNGMATSLPLLATSGPLPFDAAQSVETRRLAVTLGAGTTTFKIDGYDQHIPGGAFVVAVVNDPAAPVRTVTLLEGSDYAFHGFPPPFGPNTETGAFTFAASNAARVARLLLFTHDTRADRGDATWLLAAASGSVPRPANLVGGGGGAQRVQHNRLGVPAASGGLSRGPELDLDDRQVDVPAGADYVAFQVESAPELTSAESLALSVAVLALPVAGGDGGGGGSTTTTTLGGGGSTSTTTPGGGGGGSSTTTPTSSSTSTSRPGEGENPIPPNCGDGILNIDEECDDGNRVSGDGCDANCATEDTAETWSIDLRVRAKGVERLDYLTLLRDLPSALVGTAPVHLTLSSGEFQMLDAELPASAFRVKPQPGLAQPDGRLAKAVGQFGIWRIKLTLTPVTGIRAYDAHLVVNGEMLPNQFAKLRLTAVIRVGSVVYRATDPIRANRTGKFLRYIHPVLED